MFIGDISAKSGLSADTLRYYEKIGLIPRPLRDDGGRRVYDAAMLLWLRFLDRLKATGMGIKDRIRYAELRNQSGPASVRERRQMLERHRRKVAEDLDHLRETLGLLDDKVALYRRIEAGEIADPVAGIAAALPDAASTAGAGEGRPS